MSEIEETSMIIEELNWSWHPTTDVEVKFRNYRSKEKYHKRVKPGSVLYVSLTAVLITYIRKSEPQLSMQEVDALNTNTNQVDNICESSSYNDMYIEFIKTLKLWQEMDDF